MTTIQLRREDEQEDVSFALGRCANKISLLVQLFEIDPDDGVNLSSYRSQGLAWFLMDIEDDLRFLDDHYYLEKNKEESAEQKQAEKGETMAEMLDRKRKEQEAGEEATE